MRGARTWGKLANGSEAHIRRTGGRIGDGVGAKLCVLARGDLSASAWSAVVIVGTNDEMTTLHRSLTPNITVTIGHHTRVYFAFVTTAPVELDSPATVTLHCGAFSDVAGFAAEAVFVACTSRALDDAVKAGTGRVETLELGHRYGHLSPLVAVA